MFMYYFTFLFFSLTLCHSCVVIFCWNVFTVVTATTILLQSACRKDADKLEKVKALREASKRVTLGPDTLPSICFYTLLNSAGV